MNKRIVYLRPEGGVSVVAPCQKAMRSGETEEEFIDRIKSKDVPADAGNVTVCDVSVIPADRAARDEWGRHGFPH